MLHALSCDGPAYCLPSILLGKKMMLINDKTRTYAFLNEMENDSYYPHQLVTKRKFIQRDLCLQIEAQRPQTSEQLFKLTHAATEQFNQLSGEFDEQDSDIETVARENIAKDVSLIAQAYVFHEDVEYLIENREW